MPLNLQHVSWEPTGRKYNKLDGENQPTGELVWAGMVGEQQIQDDSGDWQPYIYDTGTKELRYANDDQRVEFASGKQVIKLAGQALCRSLKFFVQQETSPGVWETMSHGTPTREIRHNKRFKNKEIITDEGYCIGWLEFPDAQYDLQIGIQAGRGRKATFGFRFRAPISGNVRFQIVKDGIEDKIGGFELIKSTGNQEERTVGVRYKQLQWRWTWEEAAYHTLSVEDSVTYPGEKKGIITVGPFVYTANDWIEIVPLTWGLTEASDDCYEKNNTTFYAYYGGSNKYLYIGDYGGDNFNIGLTWSNVTASGTAENGCYIRPYSYGDYGPSNRGHATLKTVDARNVPAWAQGSRPSTVTKHASAVNWDDIGPIEQYINSPEIKTIIQDRFDDDHQSGDEIGIVMLDNSSPTSDYTALTASEDTSNLAVQLYIVYTAGATDLNIDVHDCGESVAVFGR